MKNTSEIPTVCLRFVVVQCRRVSREIGQTVSRETKDSETNQANIQSTGHEGAAALRGLAGAVQFDLDRKDGEMGELNRHKGFNYISGEQHQFMYIYIVATLYAGCQMLEFGHVLYWDECE
jgi:hypothetical protein